MIAAVAVDVQAALSAAGFPVRVHYARPTPERVKSINSTEIMFYRAGRETFAPPKGAIRSTERGNMVGARTVMGEILVFARSSKPSATLSDHETLTDRYVDALQCALTKVATAKRLQLTISEGAFEYNDAVRSEYAGSLYRIAFSVVRGVFDSNFEGDGPELTTLDGVTTTGTATGQGSDGTFSQSTG
jgi:hypothetical protein